MISSIFVATSGMIGHQRGLEVVSNNIGNMNTPGFRGSVVSFSDVFIGLGSHSTPSNGQRSVGGGLDASRTLLDLHVETPQQTGRDLDLALEGSGFFVLQDAEGATRYTRNGRFEFNTDGVLVAGREGLRVMSRSADGRLGAIDLDALRFNPAKATTQITLGRTLSSTPEATSHTIEAIDVFDAQGTRHTLSLKFTRATGSLPPGVTVAWDFVVEEGNEQVGEGRLDFLVDRVINSPLDLTLTLRNAGSTVVRLDASAVSTAPIGVNSTLAFEKQDGYGQGNISAQTFDARGALKITYSNGQTATGPRLALAQIGDEGGLEAVGDAQFVYQGTREVLLREAGDDLRVTSRAIELSNVDLTQQFSELILLQRGYQASSQVISTANDMLQELLQLRGQR